MKLMFLAVLTTVPTEGEPRNNNKKNPLQLHDSFEEIVVAKIMQPRQQWSIYL